MNYYYLPALCLIVVSIAGSAYAQNGSTNDWQPNTRLLDLSAAHPGPFLEDASSTLAHDVKKFYQALRDKQWHETYESRAKVFREDIPESDYLATAIKYENKWGLVNYEVLNVVFQNSDPTNEHPDTAILICKFTELPGYTVSYSTVFWHKEEGVWKCLSAGPSYPYLHTIFRGTRQPIIDWR